MPYLNEKLSISDDVINCQKNFIDYLNGISNEYNEKCSFEYNFFGLHFNVSFERRHNVPYPQYAVTNIIDKALELFYDNDDYDNFLNTITHECLHIYQYAKNKQLYQTKPLYKKTVKLLKILNLGLNQGNLSYIDEIFINALYVSFDFEQDAMVHGLYTQLKCKHSINAAIMFKNSEEFAYLSDMKKAITLIENDPDAFDEKLIGISLQNYYRMIKRQYNRFNTKMNKMIQLVMDNNLNEGLIHVRHKTNR